MPGKKGQPIRGFFNLHPRGLPGSVARTGLDTNQDGVVTRLCVLKFRSKFETVPRYDAVVPVRSGDESRWIANPFSNVVDRRIRPLRMVLGLVFG